ncbi:hypothetical protein D3C86_1146690 [compost metagenome]
MQEPSLGDLLNSSFKSQLNSIYTAMPCIVVAVDDMAAMRISVQPVLNVKYKDGTSEERPVIFNVPVMMPGTNNTLISFPISVGDTGMCMFSQRGLDTFKSGNGYPSTPTDFRKFDKRDAVFVPGLYPFGKSVNNPDIRKWPHNTNDLVISHNIASGTEVEVRLGKNGNLTINTDQKVTVNAGTAEINADSTVWNGDIRHNGSFTNTGTLTSNGTVLDTHVHSGIQPGGSNTGEPV